MLEFKQSKAQTSLALCSSVVGILMLTESNAQPARDSSRELPRTIEQRVLQIGTAATATIKRVVVAPGTRVQPGQLLVTLDCRPLEAELQLRKSQHSAAEAVLNRVRNGARLEELQAASAAVASAAARAEDAHKALERIKGLRQGVTVTQARADEVQNEARASAGQLDEARARLALLRAGSREEDIAEAQAQREAATAQVEQIKARLDQCSVVAPVHGRIVETLVTPGQFVSSAVPTALVTMVEEPEP
jgi:multidrug resistance efflux pump